MQTSTKASPNATRVAPDPAVIDRALKRADLYREWSQAQRRLDGWREVVRKHEAELTAAVERASAACLEFDRGQAVRS